MLCLSVLRCLFCFFFFKSKNGHTSFTAVPGFKRWPFRIFFFVFSPPPPPPRFFSPPPPLKKKKRSDAVSTGCAIVPFSNALFPPIVPVARSLPPVVPVARSLPPLAHPPLQKKRYDKASAGCIIAFFFYSPILHPSEEKQTLAKPIGLTLAPVSFFYFPFCFQWCRGIFI